MKLFVKTNKKNRGVLLVEVLVAASIITISVLAATAVAQKSISMTQRTLHTAQAAFLIEEGAELTRVVRDQGWANFSSITKGNLYHPVDTGGGQWRFAGDAETIDRFTRSVAFYSACRNNSTGDLIDAGKVTSCSVGVEDLRTLLVDVAVSWSEAGENVTKNIMFYIADIFSS